MRKRRRLYELSIQDDIRYRGPLSWQSFQALGWICISLSSATLVMNLAMNLEPSFMESLITPGIVVSIISTLSLPFLLIANFSRILNNSEGYKKQLIRTGGTFGIITFTALLIIYRYVIGTIAPFTSSPDEFPEILSRAIAEMLPQKFFAFNIFADLFLCSLFMFFLNARPKRFFSGKKLILFRLLAILPVVCEVASITVKGLAAVGSIKLPLWSFPLLTVKPPMAFVLFLFLAIHLKRRERRFCRHGRSHEEYQQFLTTNRNSLHFSLYLILIIIISVILDFLVFVVLTALSANSLESLETVDSVLNFSTAALAMGFGKAFPMLFVIPFLLLFSYSRTPKNLSLSVLIPIVAIGLMLLIFAEGLHQLAKEAAAHFDPASFINQLDSFGSP